MSDRKVTLPHRRSCFFSRAAISVCFLGSLAIAALPSQTASGQDIRVVRRQDRAGIILLLSRAASVGTKDSSQPERNRVKLTGFRLINLSQNTVVLLKPTSVLGLDGDTNQCPRSEQDQYPEDRVCIELISSTLNDVESYLLYGDSLPVTSPAGDAPLKNFAIELGPVGGRVILDPADPHMIEIQHSLSMIGRTDVELRLVLNGARVPLKQESAPNTEPSCYRRSTLSFRCAAPNRLRVGDSISASLISTKTGKELDDLGVIQSAKVAEAASEVSYDSKDPISDASLYVKGAFVRDGTTKVGSLQLLWQKKDLRPWERFNGRFAGSFRPYVDILLTSDTNSQGYHRVGLEGAVMFSMTSPAPVQSIGIFATPRVEADKKATVTNFIPIDIELRPALRGLYTGQILKTAYRFLPSGGYEYGRNFSGDTVTRPETANVSRWKVGATLGLAWRPDTTKRRSVFGVPMWSLEITANARRYWIRPRTLGSETRFDAGDMTAVIRFNRNIGLAVTARDGKLPPLFSTQRTTDIGLAFVY